MPLARPLRLAVVGLLVAACGGAVPSPSRPGSPEPSSLAAVSSEPSGTISPRGTMSAPASPSPLASPASAAPTASIGAAATPSPTPRPTRAPTPIPTRTAAPKPKPTAKPTTKPTAEPTPKPTPKPIVLGVTAKDSLFSPASLAGPADTPFKIVFTNDDAAIPHNVMIASPAGVQQFQGKIIIGVQAITYSIPALPAGGYRVGCTVHPAMTGSLTLN